MMIALSFLVFFALVAAWLVAPSAAPEETPALEPAPLLTTSEAAA
jgi:hypothetical protein